MNEDSKKKNGELKKTKSSSKGSVKTGTRKSKKDSTKETSKDTDVKKVTKKKTKKDDVGLVENKKDSKLKKAKKDDSAIKQVKDNKDKKNKKAKKTSDAVKMYKKKKAKKEKAKRVFNGRFSLDILDLLLVVAGTALLSCLLTGIFLNYQYKKNLHLLDRNIVSDKNVQEFLGTYSEIIDNYYEEVDSEAMMKAAMEGMLDFLEDNYSIYLNQSDSDSLSEMLDGSYEGLGIVIRGNVIEDIYKNSPAEKAGIKTGDIISSINGVEVNLENYQNIGDYIKNDIENDITVKRENEELSFKVKSSTVNIPATTTDIIKSPDKKKNIGYISLNAFSSVAYEDFEFSLMDIENEGIDSLIIDLRGNTGGYLNVATDIASLFLEKGEVIYSLENKNKITTYKDETNDKREYSIVILVNNSTASAAEILASALHDSYGAIVVGKTTYGKGKVQTMKYYEDSIVKYTSAKWLRPNGECIDEIGLVPDYDVDIRIENNEVFDTQLDKAIELLGK